MSDCLFCKILKGEIPSTKSYEDENVYGFIDIYPQSKIHNLFIHKNHTSNINQMVADEASQIMDIYKAISNYTQIEKLDQKGFRIVINTGEYAGQTVFHTHFHLLAGEPLGRFGTTK